MKSQGPMKMMMIINIVIPPATPKNIQKYTFENKVNIKFIIKMHNIILAKNYEKLLSTMVNMHLSFNEYLFLGWLLI